MSRLCPQCQQQTNDAAACMHCGASATPVSFANLLSTPAKDVTEDTATLPEAKIDDAGDDLASEAADVDIEATEAATATDAAGSIASADATPAESSTTPGDESSTAPLFSRSQRAAPATAHAIKWQWAAVAALIALLGLQVLLADRDRLATDAGWRPLLGALCGALHCTLPPWREPQAFAMLSRDVRPLPGAPGTLLVQATFRNDARWSQPWPTLQVSLSDADGRVVGARAFTAAEYLDTAETQAELAPGQSAQVSMRLREPHEGVVAFSFDFH
ncbi:MAG: DUF3426 domain-containing protein [Pseudoxanthomonas sp.]